MQDMFQGIQQRVPDSIRDKLIDDYYSQVREAFNQRYKTWIHSVSFEEL